MNNYKIPLAIIAAILILGGGWWLASRDNNQTENLDLGLGYSQDNFQNNLDNNSSNNNNNQNMDNQDRTSNLPEQYRSKRAKVETNLGDFVIEFFDNDAPLAVENFIRLSQEGKYDNSPFHRIIKGFMIQGGDYTNGNGTGGQSIFGREFTDELNPETESYKSGYRRGILAMANRGPSTNGSQFFIMHQDYPLDHNYTIFGKVSSGMETIDKIANSPVQPDARGELSVPTQRVFIEKITIENR